jgi:hypothetical protein
MNSKFILCSFIAVVSLAGCGQGQQAEISQGAASKAPAPPPELSIEDRLALEQTLHTKAAVSTGKIKSTPDCQVYSDKMQAILSVAAEPAERDAAFDKTLQAAGKADCLDQ